VQFSNIETARADKATAECRDKHFDFCEQFVTKLNSEGKVPWEKYTDIPATHIYNFDEAPMDITKVALY
jgi:hypothetical protein